MLTHRLITQGLLPLLLLVILSSCTSLPKHPPADNRIAFDVVEDKTRLTRFAPLFVIENPGKRRNLIGTPTAILTDSGDKNVHVDPSQAAVYSQERPFTTAKDSYTNLIYRIHFQEIPGGFLPYYLGKGKNVGLIVVVTLNSAGEPLLYTTVHTCGCYLAFIPTAFMPEEGFPDGWKKGRQVVHGENLPGTLKAPAPDSPPMRPMILIRDDTHRVKDLWLETTHGLRDYRTVHAEMHPLTALEALPLASGETTSFYETSGPRKGYVKGSRKSRERLLMSWWAFDWRIGEDKIFGDGKEEGIQFYTSLKPWARDASDMRDFSQFLRYWGWHL